MSKQSSIEWLWHNLTDDLIGDLPNEKIHEIYNLVSQAKQMHKEEIKSAYLQGGTDVHCKNYKGMHEYHQEKYGTDTN